MRDDFSLDCALTRHHRLSGCGMADGIRHGPGRHISRGEVDEVLKSGRINGRKSAPALRPCPKYVIDGQVGADGKNVEVRCPS